MTRAAILAANQAIADNGDYRSTGSLAKSVLYTEAVETLLALRPASLSRGGTTQEEIRFDHATLAKLRDSALQWQASKRLISGSRYRVLSMRCFRD